MAQSDIVDEDADIQTFDELLHVVIIGILVQGKVHGQCLDSNLGTIFRSDVGGKGIELRLCARNEDEVVALCCEREGKFLANAV